MPKELIRDRFNGQSWPIVEVGEPLRPGQTIQRMSDPEYRAVHVGWSKEAEHVELTALSITDPTTDEAEPSVYVQLDRAGCNRLIQVLRKARDQAFGADA